MPAMKPTHLLVLALFAFACEKPEPVDTSPPEDTAPEGPVYPTGDRIMLYTGNGGLAGAGSNGFGQYDDIDAHWKERFGWNTDVRDSLGDDLTPYRMVGLMAPGIYGGSNFTVEQIDLLEAARRKGTRVVVFNEVGNCDANIIENLLENWGVRPRFTGEGTDEFQMLDTDFIATDQMTTGVSGLRFSDPCFINDNGAPYIVHNQGDHIVVKDQPLGWGGEVVLIGDIEFLDDTGNYDLADNLIFAENLVVVDPDYSAE
jgi:hypothetical protein